MAAIECYCDFPSFHEKREWGFYISSVCQYQSQTQRQTDLTILRSWDSAEICYYAKKEVTKYNYTANCMHLPIILFKIIPEYIKMSLQKKKKKIRLLQLSVLLLMIILSSQLLNISTRVWLSSLTIQFMILDKLITESIRSSNPSHSLVQLHTLTLTVCAHSLSSSAITPFGKHYEPLYITFI